MSSGKVTLKDLSLAKRIKKFRNRAGFTQEQLAFKTGLSTTFVGMLEIGQRRPSLKSLEKVSKALGVKVKDLLSY